MFSEALKNKLVSVDIETSGLDEKKDYIWSIGTSKKGKDTESFIRPKDKSKITSLMDPKNQIFDIEDYFEPYKKALKTGGGAKSFNKAIGGLFSQVNDKSVVLIQNINFENKHIAAAMSEEQAEKFSKKFKFVSENHQGKLFYRPPEATKAMHEAARHSLIAGKLSGEGAKTALENVNKSYSKMLSEYSKAIGTESGAVVVDLIDITKATYGVAAKKGLISVDALGTGTTVDFLSRALFGAAETHGAKDDAKDQIKIFRRMSTMYDELNTGKVSDSTVRDFTRIKAVQPFESSRTFLTALRNTVEEIQSQGYTKLITPGSSKDVVRTVMERQADGTLLKKEFADTALDYSGVRHTNKPDEAMSHVVERYMHRNNAGLDIEQYANKMKGLDLQKTIDTLKEDEAIFKQKVVTRIQGSQTLGDTISDAFSGIKNKRDKFGLAAIAGLGLMAASVISSSKRENEEVNYEQANKTAKYNKSNEKTFSMYKNAGTYHGTGVYLWDNITKHHEY